MSVLLVCGSGQQVLLILTKPLGVGIVCTAARMGAASSEAMDLAVRSMTTLNRYASEVVRRYRTHGSTDVSRMARSVRLLIHNRTKGVRHSR